jgi:sodium-dependent dicarboxylate transporter 2/3/5
MALLLSVAMGVYKVACKLYGVKKDRALAVFLILGVCFAANHGGPGSSAAGGRNAIMMGDPTDCARAVISLEWMKHGMPFMPLMAAANGVFFYLSRKARFQVGDVNPGGVVKAEGTDLLKFVQGLDLDTGECLLNVAGFIRFGLPVTILAWRIQRLRAVFGCRRILSR